MLTQNICLNIFAELKFSPNEKKNNVFPKVKSLIDLWMSYTVWTMKLFLIYDNSVKLNTIYATFIKPLLKSQKHHGP